MTTDVLIRSVTAVPYRVPLRATLTSALGAQSHSNYGLVRLGVDDGVEGLGEISMIWHGDGARLCAEVDDLLAPQIVGRPLFAYEAILADVRSALRFGRHSLAAVAAVEMALLDAQGKVLGRPVVDLLGGSCASSIRLSMSLSIAAPDRMLAEARAYVEEGFTAVKVKSGRDRRHLVPVVAGLRAEHGPDLGIRVDLNMSCRTAKEALRVCTSLEPYDVLSVEQPLPPGDLAGSAFVRERTSVPIMVDEGVWHADDALAVLRAGAADLINVYVAESGGIREARRIADLAALFGVEVAIGSMPETGVGTAAAAHLAFAVLGLEHPSDVAGFRYHDADVVHHDLTISGGHLLPPTTPGLGVHVDETALDRYRTQG